MWELPAGFPEPVVPNDNPMSTAKVTLGESLFNDTRLSSNGTYSCASCHRPELAFSDGQPTAVGATGERHRRNTPSLFNVAYNTSYGWADPNTTTLEAQHRIPMFNTAPVELGTDETALLVALQTDSDLRSAYAAAFPDRAVTLERIIAALASYVRTLVSGDSPFDRYLYFGEETLSPAGRAGMKLFFSPRLGCATCHASFNLSGSVRTVAHPQVEPVFHNTGLAADYADSGLAEHTGLSTDAGAFRAPSLRNVSLTAPYMHDGSLATLDAVVAFYAGGGADHPAKRAEITGFELAPGEATALVAFLEALTGAEAQRLALSTPAGAASDQMKP